MGLVKKLKDILFEEEEDFEEPVKIVDEEKKEEPKIVKLEPLPEDDKVEKEEEAPSDNELFRSEKSFQFPDFDEEEFASNIASIKTRSNVLDYERNKVNEKKPEYTRYERTEPKEYSDKKKFKPSPIISPVYGILNQDYKAEDIVDKKDVASNIDIDVVRKKAFEPEKEETKEVIDEPVVTFFEEKENDIPVEEEPKEEFKGINELIEESSEEISLEDTIEIPKTNNIDAIEDELEKIDVEEKSAHKNLDETNENDLFELIDSMYDERGEE